MLRAVIAGFVPETPVHNRHGTIHFSSSPSVAKRPNITFSACRQWASWSFSVSFHRHFNNKRRLDDDFCFLWVHILLSLNSQFEISMKTKKKSVLSFLIAFWHQLRFGPSSSLINSRLIERSMLWLPPSLSRNCVCHVPMYHNSVSFSHYSINSSSSNLLSLASTTRDKAVK